MVLFQFAPETSEEAIEENLERARGLEVIPCVRALAVGKNMFPAVDGWTHGMMMVFDSYDVMIEEYGFHPMHKLFQRKHVPLWSRYMAMDVSSDDSEDDD